MTPPLTKLGSSPSPSRPVTIMPVEVVLPWAPATATSRCRLISQASACERCSTGRPFGRASWYSGLSCQSAPVTTSVSASPTLAASWPIAISAPSSRSSCTASVSRRSEPVTGKPASRKRRAMPLMPEPPMPTKCSGAELGGEVEVRSGLIIDHATLSSEGPPSRASSTRSRPSDRAPERASDARPCGRRRRGRRRSRASPCGHALRSSSSGSRSLSTQPGVNSASATSSAPPGRDGVRALKPCSPLPTAYGTKTAGMPSAASSLTVAAPARDDGEVGDARGRGPSGRSSRAGGSRRGPGPRPATRAR